MNTLIIGLQYGDEAKGRVSAELGKDADWFVRFNGGPNAGHTVYRDGVKYALHHLPAGALLGKKVALDTGMVIDGAKLKVEIETCGIDPKKLYISENVHLISEEQIKKDQHGSGLGTTKSGIAYVYADRALKTGARCSDIVKYDKTTQYYKGLVPIGSTENAIFESAQGIMLDIDYGCYPYVTSSSVMPSGHYKMDKKIGVMKAYTSRVGDGPPYREQIEWLTKEGQEYGTTTGRPRKCYWNDMRELDYAIALSKPDEIVVTKLDILDGKEIHIVNRLGELVNFDTLGEYEVYLKAFYPQIKYFSYSPQGPMRKV